MTINNLLPLESWRRVFNYNPWHFWGLDDPIIPRTGSCDDLVQKYDWQGPNVTGRESIRAAIQEAENALRRQLEFDIAPKFHDEVVPFPKYLDKKASRRYTVDPSGRNISVRMPDYFVQAVGVQVLTLADTANIVYSDKDNDGIYETATLTTTKIPYGTDLTTVQVYFQASDRLDGEAVSNDYRIAPVKITQNASTGVLTIVARTWQLVQPIKYEGVITWANPLIGVSTNPPTPCVAALEIYVQTVSSVGQDITTAQAVLFWETTPCHGAWCLCDSCQSATQIPATAINDPAAVSYALARVGLRNGKLGLVTPAQAVMDATTQIWSEVPWGILRDPDRVEVRYLAGAPLGSDGNIDARWIPAVARFAAAEMTAGIVACDTANRELYRWQFDAARAGGRAEEQYKVAPEDLMCPFGTRYGHLYAWKLARHERILSGIAV